MRTSLRLTPSAQRKNRVVTRISGATYRRSVMGAEVVIILSQRAIKVHVAAIHEHMLAGYVRGAGREHGFYNCRDLVGRGHSFLQRVLGQDGLKLLFGIRECPSLLWFLGRWAPAKKLSPACWLTLCGLPLARHRACWFSISEDRE